MHSLSPTSERIDALNPTERERELLTFIFTEVFRLWRQYRSLARQYRVKDALSWHDAQDRAIELVYRSNIASMTDHTD